MRSELIGTFAAALLFAPALACAQNATATASIHTITAEGVGAEIGKATLTDSENGVTIEISLKGLSGEHGFHVHEKGDCSPGEKDGKKQAGIAAGSHYDPAKTGKHAGPGGGGHDGDLPKLVLKDSSPVKVTAPDLKVADITGRALVIHEGGDTYSDNPEMGGGKGRIACGVIKAAK